MWRRPRPRDQSGRGRRRTRTPIPDPVPASDDSDDDSGDGDDDNSTSEMDIDTNDDPPVRDGPNATTIGFEFELAIAVTKRSADIPDPHPNDGRWLSDKLVTRYEDGLGFRYTTKNKIVDTLRAAGVPARKSQEYWYDSMLNEQDSGFEWWDSLEYETTNENDLSLATWAGNYQWNDAITDDKNVEQATKTLAAQFWQHHKDQKLAPHLTSQEIMETLQKDIGYMIVGVAPKKCREKVKTIWLERVMGIARSEKKAHYGAQGHDDPNLVRDVAEDEKYRAWSVTNDVSVDCDTDRTHYNIPPGSIPTFPLTGLPIGEPSTLYKWFGAEVVSPVMDYDNPGVYPSLRRTAQALRVVMRIHKPMSHIQSGVHIHIGQQAGWTLLHLKKFATLWHVIEPLMFSLHRQERSAGRWCLPMNRDSILGRLVYRHDTRYSKYAPTTTGPKRKAYQMQMNRYTPDFDNRALMRQFVYLIWQYDTLDDLKSAMHQSSLGMCSIRWRVSGNKLSAMPDREDIQTLEFRLMQGTLDADHVWKWASILERLVVFARDATEHMFRDAIAEIVEGNTPQSVGLNQEDLRWFKDRWSDKKFFTYPDKDVIDWSDPFMVPGHGDTHAR
ncbi:hypothetical protein F5B22DRAFT_659144 [Xylaria bambusicola]|uniref:uncharacterized protein n=1 Tax=Xylaria bambusicola TaxID=326684 RepID=UPI0020076EF2|nr:uncharacterized protein F5B22DRAFT_659144 [Xylaria bambusicola]KAI0508542.1 hypothetical protein F5B22DRAFT_659144 [Xylaria bambusicola]